MRLLAMYNGLVLKVEADKSGATVVNWSDVKRSESFLAATLFEERQNTRMIVCPSFVNSAVEQPAVFVSWRWPRRDVPLGSTSSCFAVDVSRSAADADH